LKLLVKSQPYTAGTAVYLRYSSRQGALSIVPAQLRGARSPFGAVYPLAKRRPERSRRVEGLRINAVVGSKGQRIQRLSMP